MTEQSAKISNLDELFKDINTDPAKAGFVHEIDADRCFDEIIKDIDTNLSAGVWAKMTPEFASEMREFINSSNSDLSDGLKHIGNNVSNASFRMAENDKAGSDAISTSLDVVAEKISKAPDIGGAVFASAFVLALGINIAVDDKPEIECPIDPTGNTSQQFKACVNDNLRLTGGDKGDYEFIPVPISAYKPN